jgi:hypothetical protein
MDHTTMVANKVDCFGCHADLAHGTGQVTLRDCQNCHDQDRYLKDFSHLTADLVRDYHRAHTAAQRARCGDCHQAIEHKLKPLAELGDAAALLAPVRDACQQCHPEHHRQQMELLLGRGGFVGSAKGLPNPMTGSRINCQACHLEIGVDTVGGTVMSGTGESCRACHSEDYKELFHRWQTSLQTRLTESQTLLAAVEQRLQAAPQPAGRDLNEPGSLHARAKQNIRLVETADGLHNKNYAVLLLDQAVADLNRALKLLGG